MRWIGYTIVQAHLRETDVGKDVLGLTFCGLGVVRRSGVVRAVGMADASRADMSICE